MRYRSLGKIARYAIVPKFYRLFLKLTITNMGQERPFLTFPLTNYETHDLFPVAAA
ncbi:MAG: hypothetical protein H6657_03470 [Ardenticatenaceae bacterium]|nr:hypothetical protein [Ardenticatenaceae bacterium]